MSDEYFIGRLSLTPGDILVVKCNGGRLSRENVADFRKLVTQYVGDMPVLILASDVDLTILTRTEIDDRTKIDRDIPERIISLPDL